MKNIKRSYIFCLVAGALATALPTTGQAFATSATCQPSVDGTDAGKGIATGIGAVAVTAVAGPMLFPAAFKRKAKSDKPVTPAT